MTTYLVNVPFTDLGVHHEKGTVIIDTSLIQNLHVKLWDGTLTEQKNEKKATTPVAPKSGAKTPAAAPSTK